MSWKLCSQVGIGGALKHGKAKLAPGVGDEYRDDRGMSMKRVLVLAGVMGLALAQGAQAADMSVQASPFWLPPVNATPDWSGPYIGFNGGYGFGSGSVTGSFFGPIVALGEPLGFSTAGNPVGAVFGGQVGYNWQQASVVFGVEGDFDAATSLLWQHRFFEPRRGCAGRLSSVHECQLAIHHPCSARLHLGAWTGLYYWRRSVGECRC